MRGDFNRANKLNFSTPNTADSTQNIRNRFESVKGNLLNDLFNRIVNANAYYLRYDWKDNYDVIDVVLDFVLENCDTKDKLLIPIKAIGANNSEEGKKEVCKQKLKNWLAKKTWPESRNMTAIDLFVRILTTKTGGYVERSCDDRNTPLTPEYKKELDGFSQACHRQYDRFLEHWRATAEREAESDEAVMARPRKPLSLKEKVIAKATADGVTTPCTAKNILAAYDGDIGTCVLESVLANKLYVYTEDGERQMSLRDIFPVGSSVADITRHSARGRCPIEEHDITNLYIMEDGNLEPLLYRLHIEGEGLTGSITQAMEQMRESKSVCLD